jgi:hypothetical protein
MPIVGSFAGASARAYGLGAGTVAQGALTLITSATFSSVASVSVNNCFSNDYVQYRIIVDSSIATTNEIQFRLRVGGVDNSSTSYQYSLLYGDGGTVGGLRQLTQNRWIYANSMSTSKGMALFEILNPFQTAYTSAISFAPSAATGGLIENYFLGQGFTATTSFDGFTLIGAGPANITGDVYVYGYKVSA